MRRPAFPGALFALGRLFAPSSALPSFFDFKHVISDGRWYSQYPFGHPLMLALGVLAGLPWLVNPLQAAAAVLALYGLGREVYTERIARIATLLFCLSPFVWFMSGSFMNHTTSLCWGTLFLLFSSRLARRGIGNALLCGLALGMVVATRPATALGIALPVAAWLFLSLRREPRLLGRAAAATGVVAAFGLLLLVQNWLTTGAPLRFGYTVLHGPGHGFVFGPAALGITHTPYKGLVHVTSNLAGLNRYLFEWPVPALILPLALVVTGTRKAWDWLLLSIRPACSSSTSSTSSTATATARASSTKPCPPCCSSRPGPCPAGRGPAPGNRRTHRAYSRRSCRTGRTGPCHGLATRAASAYQGVPQARRCLPPHVRNGPGRESHQRACLHARLRQRLCPEPARLLGAGCVCPRPRPPQPAADQLLPGPRGLAGRG